MKYTVATRQYGQMDISDERQHTTGSICYSTWLPGKAEIRTADNNVYNIAPAGFWNMELSITKNGSPYAAMKRNWRSGIVLSFENGRTLTFKRKSLWSGSYVMTDRAEHELAGVYTDFEWKKLAVRYYPEVYGSLYDKEADMLLPFLMVWCTRYMAAAHAM